MTKITQLISKVGSESKNYLCKFILNISITVFRSPIITRSHSSGSDSAPTSVVPDSAAKSTSTRRQTPARDPVQGATEQASRYK